MKTSPRGTSKPHVNAQIATETISQEKKHGAALSAEQNSSNEKLAGVHSPEYGSPELICHMLLERGTNSIWHTSPGPNPKTLYMNPAALRLFELDSLEEAINTPDTAFFSAESIRFMHTHREQRQLGKRESSYEIDMISAKKNSKRVLITPLDVHDRDGKWLSTLVTLYDITPQDALTEKLHKSEHRFQALVETSVAGIWQVSNPQDPRMAYMNPAMLRLLDIESLEVALQLNPASFFTEESLSVVIDEREKRQRGEGRLSFEVELVTMKGNRRWALVSPVDIYGQSGIWESTIVTYIDITEQHNLQAELLLREHLYQTLTENTITPIWHTKPDGTTIYMNAAAANLLELDSVEQGAYLKVEDILTPAADEIRKEQTKNRARGAGSHYELEIQTVKGNIRYVHVSAAPLISDRGEWLSSIATFVDRTEQREKEREQEKNLAMFKALLANMPEGILVEDPDHRVVAMNDILLNAFGMHGGITHAHAFAGPDIDGGEKHVALLTTDPEEYAEFIRTARASNEPLLAWEIAFRDGRSFEADYVPIYASDGEFIAHLWKYRETTERKRIEQRLRESESQYRHLFQENPHPMWVFDWCTLQFLEVNNEATIKYGYAREEFLNMTLFDLWPEIERTESEEMMKMMRGERGSHHLEVIHRTKDGRHLTVDISSREIEFEGRNSRITLAQDITECRKTENELYRSRLNLNALVENTTDMISSYDREMRLITWNSAFENLFRNVLHIEIHEGMSLRDVVAPEESEVWDAWGARGLNGEQFAEQRYYVEPFPSIIEVTVFPIVENGVITGVMFFNKNIDDRKKAEVELLRSKANVHALVENTTDIISSYDTNLRLITWNSALADLILKEFHLEVFEGMPLCDMASPSEVPMWDAWGARGLSGEQFVEERVEENDGDVSIIEVSCFPINENGTITGVMFFERDITRRKRMERELVEAKERAEEMNRLKSSFLANMSHEIRTPMTAIQGFSSLICETTKEPDTLEFSEHVLTGAKRLLSTINDILDIARIESNRVELHPNVIDLALEVENTISLLVPLSTAKNLQLRTRVIKGRVLCNLDARYFGQIITNLVSNAIKFTEHGEITIEIDTEVMEQPYAVVRVRDSGIGIHPESLNHLFDEFWQESQGSARKFESTGLGLAIVKKLTEIMSGQIFVESIPGEGTTFTLRFPLYEPGSN
jgi:PAS domain S-box-containing protein